MSLLFENEFIKLLVFVVVCSGAVRLMSSNNDSVVRVFDCNNFSVLSRFYFPWAVNVNSFIISFCVSLLLPVIYQCGLRGVPLCQITPGC